LTCFKWGDEEADLHGLRDMFLEHMTAYSRIFQLRYFKLPGGAESLMPASHFYELVKIPTSLLQESKNGVFEMKFNSSQTPKPGYCTVKGADGRDKFQLYFDGGSERKLQVKYIRKDLCVVHANWKF
jgi:type II restriction enzyme